MQTVILAPTQDYTDCDTMLAIHFRHLRQV